MFLCFALLFFLVSCAYPPHHTTPHLTTHTTLPQALAQKQIAAAGPSPQKSKQSSVFGAYNPLIVGLDNSSKKQQFAAPALQPSPAYSTPLSVETTGNRPVSTMYGGHGGMSSLLAGGARSVKIGGATSGGSETSSAGKSSPSSSSSSSSASSSSSTKHNRVSSSGSGANRPSEGASLSSHSLKVLVATSPSGKTSYPPGTLLQSPESLHEAVIRASLSMGGPLHGLAEGEEGEEEEEEGAEGGREEGSGQAEP